VSIIASKWLNLWFARANHVVCLRVCEIKRRRKNARSAGEEAVATGVGGQQHGRGQREAGGELLVREGGQVHGVVSGGRNVQRSMDAAAVKRRSVCVKPCKEAVSRRPGDGRRGIGPPEAQRLLQRNEVIGQCRAGRGQVLVRREQLAFRVEDVDDARRARALACLRQRHRLRGGGAGARDRRHRRAALAEARQRVGNPPAKRARLEVEFST
jgi:xanthine/CO dehydrogenase XdhC/CoxF family maturation factor